MGYPNYDDGLDDEGYPKQGEGWRKPYVRGSEADAGDNWQPEPLAVANARLLARVEHLQALSADCDSPIETMVGAAVILYFAQKQVPLLICKMIDLRKAPDSLLLVPQFAWGYYRSDWAILHPKRTGALLIECDGKDFHTSPEQVAHDAKKDSAALDRGYLTMRFKGSQINHSADDCAGKIFDAVQGI